MSSSEESLRRLLSDTPYRLFLEIHSEIVEKLILDTNLPKSSILQSLHFVLICSNTRKVSQVLHHPEIDFGDLRREYRRIKEEVDAAALLGASKELSQLKPEHLRQGALI